MEASSIEKQMMFVDSTGPLGTLFIPTDKMLTVRGPAQRRCMHSSCASAFVAPMPCTVGNIILLTLETL